MNRPMELPSRRRADPGMDSRPSGLSGFDTMRDTMRDNGPESQIHTLIAPNPGDYLGERPDIGRAVGNQTRELFVSCEVGDALQQQFDHLQPSYIALHDLACHAASHLLQAVAAAAGRPVQRLVIRRQGYGTTLASLEFVDCPTSHQSVVRIYSTDADTDTQSRTALTRVLLSRATLSVVMMGDLPGHAVPEQLQPLRELLFSPTWECPHLQLMPLAPATAIALKSVAGGLTAGAGVQTRLAPMVSRPAEAWAYLSATWNHIQAQLHPDGQGMALLDTLAPSREVRQAMPDTRSGSARPKPMERFVHEVSALPGVRDICLFEVSTSRVLAHAGVHPKPTELARRGTLLLAAAASNRKQLDIDGPTDELLLMGGLHAQGLRMLHSHPGIAMHVIFTPTQTDWPQLRPKLMALDAALPRGPVI